MLVAVGHQHAAYTLYSCEHRRREKSILKTRKININVFIKVAV